MKNKEYELKKWIEDYSRPLLNRAVFLLSNKEDANDIVQDVFLVAHSRWDSFEHKSTPLTYLTGILDNKVADWYKKRYRRPVHTNLDHFFDETGSWRDAHVLDEWDSEQELIDYLDRCLELLPLRWKLPLKLYYLQEKKAPEVCRDTGITAVNLWKILQRGRLQLRECIESHLQSPEIG